MGVELADIFNSYGAQYREKFGDRIPARHRQAMRAIEQCRTEVLGGHVYHCQGCNEIQYSYHSCRNRHCPKCQNENGQQWLEKQETLLLPTPYFLLTFTVPAGLREIVRSNQTLFYNLLFRSSAAATQLLADDPRFVGGQIGMIGVLHTWGRNLAFHPHVHFLVPAGGLDTDTQTWLTAKKNFLLPVRALSTIFRAKFRDALRKTTCFDAIPTSVWKQAWVVHCQPVGNGLPALKYLTPYIFRVAISNNRILKLSNGKVTFRYKDTDTGQSRVSTLSAEEFIRRFLQHVLPKGFVKVRYYGFFSPSLRQRLSSLQQHLDNVQVGSTFPSDNDEPELEANQLQSATSFPDHKIRCPVCGQPMKHGHIIRPRGRCPP